MSQLDPHALHQLVSSWLSSGGNPAGAARLEPVMGTPPAPDDPQAQLARQHGVAAVGDALAPGSHLAQPDAGAADIAQHFGGQAVDQAMDQEMTQQWQDRMRAAREGQKAVGDAMSKVKRSPKADKQATQDWINKMRAAREGQGAVAGAMDDLMSQQRAEKAGQKAVKGALKEPLFPPPAFHDPNLPQGPHVRSPGKPEDEPPVSE